MLSTYGESLRGVGWWFRQVSVGPVVEKVLSTLESSTGWTEVMPSVEIGALSLEAQIAVLSRVEAT